jgi:Ca-activated chloride channel homolog
MSIFRPGRSLAVAAAVSVAAMLGAHVLARGDRQQFRSGVDLVRLPVVVTGKDGLLVRGLKPESFELFEDGVRQKITAFAEGAPGEAVPLHLGLVLDRSGSMEKDIRDAGSAAIQFVSALEEAADTTLVDFNANIRIGRFEPPSYPHLFERIRDQKAEGMTSLWDALGAYVQGASSREGQHVVVLFTDGGDSTSRLSYDQLLKLLRANNVIVYVLGYLEHALSSDRVSQQMRLPILANETGGDAFFPSNPKELNQFYARILDELGSRYTIGYVSTNTRADGRFRKVQLKLAGPESRNAKVRTRAGYLAPEIIR